MLTAQGHKEVLLKFCSFLEDRWIIFFFILVCIYELMLIANKTQTIRITHADQKVQKSND